MASLGYETQDAATYAEWGVDYLKVQCFTRFFFVLPCYARIVSLDALRLMIWIAIV